MNQKDLFYRALSSMNQPLGVISTINEDGSPESASVYYVFDKDLALYFFTREGSRKWENVNRDNRVSFVVSTESPAQTFQLQGIAQAVTEAAEEIAYFSDLVSLASQHIFMPPVSQIGDSKMVFVKISPTWVRVGDFGVLSDKEDKFSELAL